MKIKAICQACGNQKQASASRVGEFIPCEFCGGMMRLAHPERQDPFKKAAQGDVPPSAIQMMGFLLGLFNGLLCISGAAIITFAGALGSGDKDQPDTTYLKGGMLAAFATAYAILGLLYIFCGSNIRAKGATSAMVVLVFAPVQATFTAALVGALSPIMQTAAGTGFIKYPYYLSLVSLVLLLAFIVVCLAALVTHPSAHWARAGRFFTLMAIYGYLSFAAFLALQALLILGYRFDRVQLPVTLQDHFATNFAVWLGFSTLFWLLGISITRTTYFGTVFGLLICAGLGVLLVLQGVLVAPVLLGHRDLGGYIWLGSWTYTMLLLLCPMGLLIRGLFSTPPAAVAEPEAPAQRFVFDM